MSAIPLHRAEQFAERIVGQLTAFCTRVEVVGSIRRRRPEVNDIDLVVLPRDREAFKARCLRRCRALTNGEQNFIFETDNGIQVDVFFAREATPELFAPKPGNWGALMVCRTGSKEHNIYLCQHAQRLGMRYAPYDGVYDIHNKLIASDTEQEIFDALRLDYIRPEDRER